ncbi:unnamed protein product [Agarophyton chilense]|eukprot:gb/GEZJ01005740.1/.p1 GENE.gb/GEZJ01005740.1/~~gb/GEZJ01005740.1/.p1  ORF type:complete len:334 (-),score=39.69 gb/GEZJ01005740.1/:501-1502(-)
MGLDATFSHESLLDEQELSSIRLQYPKSSRLLLGTTANLQQPAFLKALETHYPLELSLECRELHAPLRLLPFRQARPFAVFLYCEGPDAPWKLIGRTETVLYDEYPRFVTKLKVCCATEHDRQKVLRVELFDRRHKSEHIDDQTFIGAAQCTLEDIIAEPLLRKELEMNESRVMKPGRLIISADAIRAGEKSTRLVLSLDMASGTKKNHRVFYVLSRQLQSGEYTPVYRSEVLTREQKRFESMSRDLTAVTAGVDDKLLRLELYQFSNRGAHIRLGFMQTSIEKLKSTERHSRLLWWPNAVGDGDGVIEVGRVVMIESVVSSVLLQFRLRVTQ